MVRPGCQPVASYLPALFPQPADNAPREVTTRWRRLTVGTRLCCGF